MVAKPVPGSFLTLLDGSTRAELERLGVPRSFPRGSVLVFEHEPEGRVVVLLSGHVKVSRTDQDGRELVLDVGDPGDLLGELAFIDGRPRMATVTALETVNAIVIGSVALATFLGARPDAMTPVVEVIAHRLREAQTKRSQLTTLDTMGRLAARLVEMAERYGEPTNGRIALMMPLTREELASWAGASRAAMNDAFRTFRQLGWITTRGRTIEIQRLDALRARGQ